METSKLLEEATLKQATLVKSIADAESELTANREELTNTKDD